ncbi:MAG: phenylacetate-CoA oxygenase/reductase subunit PaaK [Flavobacteriaceae bacterium]|nr:phenylacetate-CoA oxygenase/reductase subunit PaaK [Flavobacteriaceae bacterium]
MTKFYKIEIKDIYKETENCSVINFNIPENLTQEFHFKQGQYLTLKTNINGDEVRRSYSLCSSPVDNEWKVAVKKIEGGKFSTYVNEDLKVGDVLEVMRPDGKFYVEIDSTKPKNYIAFAAGSGITPVISIIKAHLKQEPQSTFKLFYLNKEAKSIIFKEELEGLSKEYLKRFEVFHFLTQEQLDNNLLNGRFSKEKLKQIASKIVDLNTVDECFICGPEEMLFLIKDELTALGLPSNKIHFELFEVSKKEEGIKEIKYVNNAEVTVIVDGDEYTFKVSGGTSILEAAEENDADVPFACKGGVCCTCKAKVLEGTVEMLVNYGLEEDDLAQGMVLTCQSLPTSKKVVVDYDV